jgi:hypothetical protein
MHSACANVFPAEHWVKADAAQLHAIKKKVQPKQKIYLPIKFSEAARYVPFRIT